MGHAERRREKSKHWHAGLCWAISCLAFPLGYGVDQACRWTDHRAGAESGIMQGFFFAPIFGVLYLLPWTLVVVGIYRRTIYERFRSLWLMLPGFLFLIMIGSGLIFSPTRAEERFSLHTGTPVPHDAQILHYDLRGGGFVDITDTMLLSFKQGALNEWIDKLGLQPRDGLSSFEMDHPGFLSLHGALGSSFMQEARVYNGMNHDGSCHILLIADVTRSRACLVFSRI